MSPAGTRRGPARTLVVAGALALCIAALAALPGAVGAGAITSQAKPNIILVTTDDQALSMLRPRFMPKTFEHIAAPGTTFTNAIATTPLCCPSRASMLTGQYAHNHEVLQNAYQLLADKDNVLPVWLRRAGYRTAHVGKFLNGYERAVGDGAAVAPGWDSWFTTLGATRYFDYDVSANGKRLHFGKGRRSHVTRVINRKAVTVVRRFTSDSKPLFLQVDHRAPHTETGVNSGGRCGARAVPEEPRDEERLRGERLPNPPSFNEADVSDKPSFIRDRPLLNHRRVKKITKRYECALAALRSVDRGVSQIVEALEYTGDLHNTVLAFTTDNGFYFGEHRIARDKTHPYEEALRLPLVMRVPPQFLGGAPVVPHVTAQVANIDLAPTFLELAGGDPCPATGECRVMDGRSMMPLLRGQAGWPVGRALLVEYDGAGSKGTSSCRYDGMRTASRFYVEHLAIPDPLGGCRETEEFELYDLQSDPFQLQNLYSRDDPDLEPLRERLARLRDCNGLEGRDPVPEDGSYCE
jgi:N-acetylglucosamine-6-sulfatase